MITSPNDIPNCVLWLDSHDRTTLFQDISVASSQRRNLYTPSDTIRSVLRSDVASTDNSWMNTTTVSVSAPDQSSNSTYVLLDGNRADYGSDSNRRVILYQYAPRTASYCLSFFVKAYGSFNFAYFEFDGTAGYVDLTTASVSANAVGSVTARLATNDFPSTPTAAAGWVRVFITKTLTSSTTPKELILRQSTTRTSAGWLNRLNTPGNGINIWGIMLEENGAAFNSFIPTRTIEGAFLDGTRVSQKTIPISPVTGGNQRVAYWKNKSLSADAFQLSGLQVFEENGDYRPTLSTSGTLTSLRFDYDYLSTPVLDVPVDTSSQTLFAVMYATWDNSTHDSNRAMFTQVLSGVNPNPGGSWYYPLVYPRTFPMCSVVGGSAVAIIPVSPSWYYRTPVAYSQTNNTAWHDNLYKWGLYRTTKHANGTYSCAFNRIATEYSYGEGPEISNNGNRASRYSNPTPRSISAADVFRIGTGIGSTVTLDHDWSLGWPLTRRGESGRGMCGNLYEIVLYNRELTKDEINDVEDYLMRRWYSVLSSRQVWALSDGELSSSNIFSISSEPSPFNVLLSSDIIYTNGYTLTATANQYINVLTNAPTPVTGRSGGVVVMTEGVTLSAKVIGGSAPGAILVPPNTNCTIIGNVHGGASRYETTNLRPASALNVPGVYVLSGGMLNLSGSAFGGFEVNSPGISVDGGRFDYSGYIEGAGYRVLNNAQAHIGGTRGFGASAINSNLYFKNRRIQAGTGCGGLFVSNCNVVLENCVSEMFMNQPEVYYVPAGSDKYGITPIYANVGVVCSNTSLTALNTMFIGVTSASISPASGTYENRGNVRTDTSGAGSTHAGTALWSLNGSKILMRDCLIEGSRRAAASWNTVSNAAGQNQAVRISSSSSLTGINCTINGGRNTIVSGENEVGKLGLYIDSTANAQFINVNVNTDVNAILNRAIYVEQGGTLALSGTVKGGYRAVSTAFPAIYNRGNLLVDGIITPNYSGSPAIDNESNGVAAIYGKIRPGGPLCNTITSRGQLTAFYTEPLISSTRGFVPIQALHCVFVSLCSNSLYTQFSVDGVQTTMQYLDNNYNLNQPLSTDVLKDYVYGPLGFELTGTSIIPEVSATIIGVPVRSVYGSRKPLTVDAFWNQPITSVTTLSTAVYEKLINPVTSVALSAITQSLTDLPPPGI